MFVEHGHICEKVFLEYFLSASQGTPPFIYIVFMPKRNKFVRVPQYA